MGDYNQFAKLYAQETERAEAKTRAHFYTLLPSSLEGKLLLDVGCGSGHDAEYYSNQGAKVHGIDKSTKEIEMASAKGCGLFTTSYMNALPYKSNTFDIITSVYALQASDDVAGSLLEMIRVAKPGATILVNAKHPLRNLLESYVNDNDADYYAKRNVTSYIFNKSIKLTEPGHTLMDYLSPAVLKEAKLEILEEHTDFPASEQVIEGMNYPTYMIMRFRKNDQ